MKFETTKEMNQYNEITLLKLQLQKYRSLVKTVDPDNLPKDEVYVWCSKGFILGFIFQSLKDLELKVDSYYGTFTNPTHYITQKDLIALITGG